MKFLLDQDVYASTYHFLRDLNHDVIRVGQIGLSQAEDKDLLQKAQEQGRLFVTRDRHFGNLVFVKAIGTGVLYPRILPSTRNAVHRELIRVLRVHTETELKKAFVVIEPGGYRFRSIAKE